MAGQAARYHTCGRKITPTLWLLEQANDHSGADMLAVADALAGHLVGWPLDNLCAEDDAGSFVTEGGGSK